MVVQMLDLAYNLTASGGVPPPPASLTKSSIRGASMADKQLPLAGADSQSYSQCRSCADTLPASGFYASNLHHCKECVKAGVRKNRADNIDHYRSYDRKRYREDDARRQHCKDMGKTIPMSVLVERNKVKRLAEPHKYKARNAVNNALRNGRIEKGNDCFFCGSQTKLQAHHQDYSRPLDVFWLCPPCHGKLHTVNGDFHRPKPGAV